MKKSLLALAVFGAFSGAAFAQSNVQLYGIIDVGVTHFTGLKPAGGGAGTVSSTGLSSGVQSGSRIGVKGTEDLGGGLKAFFDAETGFCAAGTNQDTYTIGASGTPGAPGSQTYCTGGGFMQRQAFVGLAGNFGTVSLGRQYTPAFLNEVSVDPFGFGLTGNIGNLSLVGRNQLWRANQAAAYVTPNLSGFTGTVAYSFAPAAPGTVPAASGLGSNVPRAMALNGQYANGPIMAGIDYTRITNVVQNPTSGVNDGAFKLWQVYGSYDFGIAKVSGIYEKASADYTSNTSKYWMLGASFPVGPGAILTSYGQNKTDTVGTAKQYAIGYTYSLSKRTNLYTSYAHISNEAASASLAGTAFADGTSTDSFAGVNGQGSSGFALGIRHQF